MKEKRKPKKLNEQESAMNTLVDVVKSSFIERDPEVARAGMTNVIGNLEPLGYWLPYKDLARLVASRFHNGELRLMSTEELGYIGGLLDKLVDKDSDVGLGTVPEFEEKLEALKSARNSSGISVLSNEPMDKKLLAGILLPQDWIARIEEYRPKNPGSDEKVEGLWSVWNNLSAIAESEKGLENILKSGVTLETVNEYVYTFMRRKFFSNQFNGTFTDDVLFGHITSIFELAYRVQVNQKTIPVADVPKYLDMQIHALIRLNGIYPGEDYAGWPGTREFMLMKISNSFAERKFLGQKWTKYDPDEFCYNTARMLYIDGKVESADYVVKIGDDCGHLKYKVMPRFEKAVMDFAVAYQRQGIVDEAACEMIHHGVSLFKLNHSVGGSPESFSYWETELSQPIVLEALGNALEKGSKNAESIFKKMKETMDIEDNYMLGGIAGIAMDMNATPYADGGGVEPTEHLEARIEELLEDAKKSFVEKAAVIYRKIVNRGIYLEPVDERNTKIPEIDRLYSLATCQIAEKRKAQQCDNYVYVSADLHLFAFTEGSPIHIHETQAGNAKSTVVMVGNICSYDSIARIFGYNTGSHGGYDPEKDSPDRRIVVEFEDPKHKELSLKQVWGSLYQRPEGNKIHLELVDPNPKRNYRKIELEFK